MESISPENVGFSSERLERIGPMMQAYVDRKELPGLITLIAHKGKIVHFGKFGLMDIETNKPMQADTIFRIYSMTKPVTNVAAMMLYEEGHFQLNDPLSKFIPAFKDVKVLGKSSGADIELVDLEREITIRDLMTHTSGLTYDFLEDSPVDALYKENDIFDSGKTLQENIEALVKLPLVHQPGTAWRYSVSTDVLGYLVEVIAGTTLDTFFKERIFAPLGMTDTGFSVPQNTQERLATLYYQTESGQLATLDPPEVSDYTTPPQLFSGGGGLVSTMSDYLRFSQMILNGGELDGIRLLGPRTVSLMAINHLPDHLLPMGFPDRELPGLGFGLGFAVVLDAAQTQVLESVGNIGWGGAASTHFWIDPQEDLIAILMTQFMPLNHYPLETQFKILTYQALVQ